MEKIYVVYRWVDGAFWYWGKWSDRNRANEVAMELGNGSVFEYNATDSIPQTF